MDPKKALRMIGNEHHIAEISFRPMASPHEGYAVIKEELDELWEEIKKKPSEVQTLRIRAEACQVAAMALRLMQDCT